MNRSTKKKRAVGRRPKSGPARGDTRAEILKAARRVFARRGLDGASVREVAEAASVNNAMIYYHFKDKVELYRAVLSDSFAGFNRIWNHEIFSSSASARDKIKKYVEELIRFQHSNEDVRRILSIELASCGRNFKWVGESLFRPSYQKLAKIITDGMKRGELKKIEPVQAIASLVGIVTHSFVVKPVAEYVSGKHLQLPVRQFGAFVTDMFFDGLGTANTPSRTIRVKKAART
jgi:TetR/AcrR family transcriptional regulator